MDKINFENLPSTKTPVSAENLNAMQINAEKVGNYIGSTQPSTGENVWIKKGKNLIDMSKIFALGTFNNNTGAVIGRTNVTLVSADSTTVVFKSSASWSGIVYFADVLPNTEYTYKFETDQPNNDYVLVEGYNNTGEHTRRIVQNGQEENTFTTNSNEYKIGICIETTTLLNTNITISNLQLEQNSTATSYEPYVEKEILVKNDNGVFEEFVNIDEIPGKNVLHAENLGNVNGFSTRKLIFNDNYCVYGGTGVTRFTNGVLDYNASSLGLSQTPLCVLLTPCSQRYSLRYDYDSSTKSNLRIELINNGQVYSHTGNVRFSMLIFETLD